MRNREKALSRVNLADLLRKKRKTLKVFLKENGIITYDRLLTRCELIGVVPPNEKDFLNARGVTSQLHEVSSPTDGIVVLEPAQEIQEENTDNNPNENTPELNEEVMATEVAEQETQDFPALKKRKKKLQESP